MQVKESVDSAAALAGAARLLWVRSVWCSRGHTGVIGRRWLFIVVPCPSLVFDCGDRESRSNKFGTFAARFVSTTHCYPNPGSQVSQNRQPVDRSPKKSPALKDHGVRQRIPAFAEDAPHHPDAPTRVPRAFRPAGASGWCDRLEEPERYYPHRLTIEFMPKKWRKLALFEGQKMRHFPGFERGCINGNHWLGCFYVGRLLWRR